MSVFHKNKKILLHCHSTIIKVRILTLTLWSPSLWVIQISPAVPLMSFIVKEKNFLVQYLTLHLSYLFTLHLEQFLSLFLSTRIFTFFLWAQTIYFIECLILHLSVFSWLYLGFAFWQEHYRSDTVLLWVSHRRHVMFIYPITVVLAWLRWCLPGFCNIELQFFFLLLIRYLRGR